MILTKEQILAADNLRRSTVEVPEWGGSVMVRELNLAERLALETAVQSDKANAIPIIVAGTVCDESGTISFSQEEALTFSLKSAAVMVRIAKAAQR